MADEDKQPSAPRTRMGILGTSDRAVSAIIDPCRTSEFAEVYACASRDPTRATKFANKHGILKVHSSYEDLLQDSEVDAVCIFVPVALRQAWAMKALEAGKHVFVDDHGCCNAAEGEQLRDAAVQYNKLVFVGMHFPYHPMVLRIKELCASELGKIQSMDVDYCYPVFRSSDARYNLSLGGGALMDAGVAAISLVRMLVEEEPDEILSANSKAASPDVDQRTEAKLAFPSGATATVNVSIFAVVPKISLRVFGQNGSVIDAINWAAPHMLYNVIKVQDKLGTWREEKFSRKMSTYDYEFKAFIDAIRSGHLDVTTDAAFSLATQVVIDSIYTRMGMALRAAGSVAADKGASSDGAGAKAPEAVVNGTATPDTGLKAALKKRTCF